VADIFRAPLIFAPQLKKRTTESYVVQNLLVLTLVAPVLGTIETRPATFTAYKKHTEVQVVQPPNLLTQQLSGPALVPIAFGNSFSSFQKKKELSPIVYASRGIDPGAPIVPPATFPLNVPPFNFAQNKRPVYNIVHWNAQTSTLDFEPIASAMSENLNVPYKKQVLADTSLGSVNTRLFSTAQTFTLNPSGGITFSGSYTHSNDKTYAPSGVLTLSGNTTYSHLRNYAPNGAITFSGTNTLRFLPLGVEIVTTKLPMTGAGQT
jgi:hypothetical protein